MNFGLAMLRGASSGSSAKEREDAETTPSMRHIVNLLRLRFFDHILREPTGLIMDSVGRLSEGRDWA